MNCARCQDQIIAALAAGQQFLSAEASDHLYSCARCAEYFQSQRQLFRSIDAGLHSFVNQPVPPSFLPGVRLRLDQPVSPALSAKFRWHLTAIAAAAMLAICVGYLSRRPILRAPSSSNSFASNKVIGHAPVLPAKSNAPLEAPPHKKTTNRNSSSAPPNTEPEIIVSAEERQAFARFVADDPEPVELAVAMAPADEVVQESAEMALLQIKSLEVKPLEDSASE